MKSKWIEHKGKRLFFADYSNFNDFESFKEEVDYSTSITIKEPLNSVRMLVGVTGYRRIFLRAVVQFTRMDLKPFDDIDQAKEWLVEDD